MRWFKKPVAQSFGSWLRDLPTFFLVDTAVTAGELLELAELPSPTTTNGAQ